MHSRLHSVDGPGLRPAHGKENLMPRRWSEQPPIALPSVSSQTPALGPIAASARDPNALPHHTTIQRHLGQREGPEFPQEGEVQSNQPAGEGLSLTLIRRYDGSQWNVGKVFNACESGAHMEKLASSQVNDIAIQITTPGYSKYHPPSSLQAPVTIPQTFERRLLRPRKYSEGNASIDNSSSQMNQRRSRMIVDFRSSSRPRSDEPYDFKECTKQPPERTPTGTQGYSFFSPWNGTCEFGSSVTGQALKCKHTAPEQGSQAVMVSELRFNLPTSSRLGTASSNVLRSPGRPRSSKRKSYFGDKRGSEPTYPEASDQVQPGNEDEDEQLNLSLGQERAGGGFGGKQAKLGKLIVEPEGLKMLDLVVSMNMALYWKAYERSA
ncbi:MAG: hypothetical protein Q9169_000617 [Polycauliona sp. 2 TL-2023]